LVKNTRYELYLPLKKPVQTAEIISLITGKYKPEAAMKAPLYSSDAQNVTIPSENTPEHSRKFVVLKWRAFLKMGRTESQKGQRLTLRCPLCNRVLRIYYRKKTVSYPAKLVALDGSVHQTGKTIKIIVQCKCGNTPIFEKQSPNIGRYGWRRIQ
jgi:hypothetical protein